MASTSTSPLEVPEILRMISRFVSMKDACVCAQVCKAWTNAFVSAIWHTIDFTDHTLYELDAKILAKYGGHIRVVREMGEDTEVLVILLSKASKLRELEIDMGRKQSLAHVYDVIRRNNTTLENIDITFADKNSVFVVDALFPVSGTGATSRLTSFCFQRLTITREAFSSILKHCPSLTKLHLDDVILPSLPVGDDSGADCYQHRGVTELTAPVEQVFRVVSESEKVTSLLVHFPNLITWKFSGYSEVSIKEIRNEVTRCCPLLKSVWATTPPPLTVKLLAAFKGLTTIVVLNEQLSAEMVKAILNHQDTLLAACTLTDPRFDDYDVVPEVENDQVEASEWIIQAIPRRCGQLEALELPYYEMDVDDIEGEEWICHGLEVLYIRIHGLNTKEKIDRAIQLWIEGRIAIKKTQMDDKDDESLLSDSQLYAVIPKCANSIEARVARHLLKFRHLQRVWFGWRIRDLKYND
ncbi:hypothetical protein BGZ65_003235 [Modicella reniformis]|uniref:F-box domain-containing protein n=1 Tax=Modicella reniformis TaxID=1440133 RepID=A0A9P6LS07_9FUNG|nr:hypothetical protein BGZ65_003235 [Modicella reniformis]